MVTCQTFYIKVCLENLGSITQYLKKVECNSPGGPEQNLINKLKWCHFGQSWLGKKYTSLKMKHCIGCQSYQTSKPFLYHTGSSVVFGHWWYLFIICSIICIIWRFDMNLFSLTGHWHLIWMCLPKSIKNAGSTKTPVISNNLDRHSSDRPIMVTSLDYFPNYKPCACTSFK